jgi:hypothetical protein
MAKKITPPEAPIITKLPLPNSENALVIDLPDGQKLVVGKMATGTVIEVATWRGTGRPDSRTTRLMLGVTSQEANAGPTSEGGSSQIPAKKTFLAKVQSLWTQTLNSASGFLLKFKYEKKEKLEKPRDSAKLDQPTSSYSEQIGADDQVQAWLDSITAKSEKKASEKVIIVPSRKQTSVTRKSTPKKSTGKR